MGAVRKQSFELIPVVSLVVDRELNGKVKSNRLVVLTDRLFGSKTLPQKAIFFLHATPNFFSRLSLKLAVILAVLKRAESKGRPFFDCCSLDSRNVMATVRSVGL